MSSRERAVAPSKVNKACGRLDKRPYPRVLCGSKTRSHSRTLSKKYVRFAFLLKLLYFVAHARLVPRLSRAPPTHEPENEAMHMHDRKARATPSNWGEPEASPTLA